MKPYPKQGFTLLELSIVLVIIALVSAMAMSSGVNVIASARISATNQKMRTIEAALQSYRETNNRLPCPADLTIAEGVTNFGIEAANPGSCIGGTPAANFSAAGVTNTTTQGVEGALPVVTLGLSNDFMYDGWGNRLRYAVDIAYTAPNGFAIPSGCNSNAITINDALGNPRSTGAVYALISHGANGHGGYGHNGVISSSGSTNTDELKNCHCDNNAVATTYAPLYVLKDATNDAGNVNNVYDDIVTYKNRWQMVSPWEKPASCGSNIYVTDYVYNRIQEFDLSGNFVYAMGSGYNGTSGTVSQAGTGNGQFAGPLDILFDSAGSFYIADSGNNRVSKFSLNGTFIFAVGTGYNGAGGTIGSTGSGPGQFYTNGAPMGIALDPTGSYLFVTDLINQRVQKFSTTDGSYISSFTTVTYVQGISIDKFGQIYTIEVGPTCQLIKRSSTGSIINSTGTCGGGINNFNSNTSAQDYIYVEPSGAYLWVSDYGNNIVKRYDTATLTVQSSIAATSVSGIAFDGYGHIYLSNDSANTVCVFNPITGAAVNQFNGGTSNCFGGSGMANNQFGYPAGLAIK